VIPHSKPSLGAEEKNACAAVLESGHIAQGPVVRTFERMFCAFTGRKYAVAVSSGTTALALSLRALGIGKNDEVILPSYNCTALLHAVLGAGAKPVPADIDASDFNIAPAAVMKKITGKTKAILAAHLFGRASDMEALKKLGVPVIEDGTQALGARAGKRKVGAFGALSVFSFYATKMMTTGEGGMVLTDSKRLAEEVMDLREYDKKAAFRPRTNSKMTDLAAAVGVEQLKKLPGFVERRRAAAEIYSEALRGIHLGLPVQEGGRDHVYFRYVVRIGRGLEKLLRRLLIRGIEAKKPIFVPLHRCLGMKDSLFPETARAMKEACSLPIFPSLSAADCRETAQVIRRFMSGRKEPLGVAS
jgi:dTDP-4-amino-4,6-dideoxygalactose transaminase